MAPNRTSALVIGIVLAIQLAAWGAAGLLSVHHPALLALYGLAYSLGLRHGLDADHITAIDNVSRDLIGRGVRPIGLGLFFALGHSSVISLASLATAGLATRFNHTFGHFREWASVYTTLISITLLLLVAPRNLVAAWRSFRGMRGATGHDHSHRQSGILVRWVVGKLGRLRVEVWHMFLIGALFGLGFETASAMTVLALTGSQAAGGAAWTGTLVFPLLFTAGMTLVDTTDAMFVEYAYCWALRRPREHAIYNLAVTGFSAAAALFVGAVELNGLIGSPDALAPAHSFVMLLQSHFDALGAAVALILGGIWLLAVLNQRKARRRDEYRGESGIEGMRAETTR